MNRRNMRYQSIRGRAYRNMRTIQGMSRKETYLRGIGQGFVFMVIGGILLALNMQKVGGSSLLADWQGMPFWAQFLGGGLTIFGLCWAARDAYLLLRLLRSSQRTPNPPASTDQAG
jgi:hypothetical protein